MHVEHIEPTAGDTIDNLCLACPSRNLCKGAATVALDEEMGHTVALFKPRLQNWVEHFEWIDGGLRVQGITPVGRATVRRLKMNQPRIIRARQNWIVAGTHPPEN
jgi:hypothetical protein